MNLSYLAKIYLCSMGSSRYESVDAEGLYHHPRDPAYRMYFRGECVLIWYTHGRVARTRGPSYISRDHQGDIYATSDLKHPQPDRP